MTPATSPVAADAAKPAPAPACTLVIFGGGGDLTKRLLMPALYNLARSGLLDAKTKILGVDHGDGSDDGWRDGLTRMMQSFVNDPHSEFHPDSIDPDAWGFVRERLHYLQGDFLAPETYQKIQGAVQGNAIFYFAVAARFFSPIAKQLGAADLLKPSDGAFRHLVIEKPFGSDVASARALDADLLAVADESQLYRIDHFLGKEAVQGIMEMRFANRVFEPLWRAEHIDHVQITAAETIGVEQRGSFYEPTGALRDMVPNHLFQLLCMTAMEPPASLDAEAIRDEKARLVAAIQLVKSGDAVRGQYGAGSIAGQASVAYRSEPAVAPDSRTETYAALKLEIQNERWQGVPFYLRTGKKMRTRRTEVALIFKPTALALFGASVGQGAPNVLRLQIDPEEGARLSFDTKLPGPRMQLATVSASFQAHDVFAEQNVVGYETLLYDCMLGDATLFQRADSIEGAWAVVAPALDAWTSGEPQIYPAGSDGPADADALLQRDGRAWLTLDDDSGKPTR